MKQEHQEDYNLVNRFLLGDKDAGQELYLRTIPVVRRFVYSRTQHSILSTEEKDEVIVNTLHTSVEKLGRYTGESAFTTFLIGICINKIRQTYKAHTIESRTVPIGDYSTVNAIENDLFALQYGRDPLQIVIEKEKRDALNQALDSLDPNYKNIIILRLINRVPVKEISRITGKSVSAIDSLFRRAVKKFRDQYNKIYL